LKGLGWVPDPEPNLLSRAGSKLRASRALLGAISRPSEGGIGVSPWVLDQGTSQSCTGHFAAEAIYGLTLRKCSPWFPWFWGRAYDRGSVAGLANVGVSSSSVRRALSRHGACGSDMWRPGVDGFGWEVLPDAVARANAQRFNLTLAPIWEVGETALESVLDALGNGFPVGVVVDVDPGFDAPVGDTIGPAKGPSRGRHIVTGWRWRTVQGEDGPRRQVQIVNSWGTGWAGDGCAWLDEDRIKFAPYLCAATGVT
jgi:hypothetical protein